MPIPVKTQPRFKCQFCLSHRGVIHAVEKHEGICFQNPNRYCPHCENTGKITRKTWDGGYPVVYGKSTEPCSYCSKEDKEVTASLIASREQVHRM